MFELEWTEEVKGTYQLLKGDASQQKRYKAVRKTIDFLSIDPGIIACKHTNS